MMQINANELARRAIGALRTFFAARALTRLDWWLGVVCVSAAVVMHAAIPRYEWRDSTIASRRAMVRIDRWTGTAEIGSFNGGVWVPPAR